MGDADSNEDAAAAIDCRAVVEELYTFLDGELSDDRRVQIERHYTGCPGCHEIVEFHASLKLTISAKCQEPVPDALRQRIRDALPRRGIGALRQEFQRTMSSDHVAGTSINGADRPSKAFGKNRQCGEPGCETRLSMYNNGKYCYLHEPMAVPRTRGKKIA